MTATKKQLLPIVGDIMPTNQIENLILDIRGQQVMLDRDLANLYGVDTKVLNQAVKRNIERFPVRFRFQLSDLERDKLVTNCDRLQMLKHSNVNPFVFTHHVPTHLCTAEEFRGSTISGAFTVELGDYIADSGIDYWIYGHSHRNIDAQIGNTRLMSNQLGYISYNEQAKNGFNPSRYIDIYK